MNYIITILLLVSYMNTDNQLVYFGMLCAGSTPKIANKTYNKPCLRLERGKFKLTNQDSAGGKKILSSRQCKLTGKGIESRQPFSLEMA